jgi:triosephosphate isomerase
MRQRLVAGNWKMHGSLPGNQGLLEAVAATAARLQRAQCAVCVPFPYLAQAQHELNGSKAAWGAQNMSEHPKGAFTGEVSAGMLKEFGCTFVIVGHSERRSLFAEKDTTVALKAQAALSAGLVPIVCIGETLSEREGGETEQVVGRQLDAVLERVGPEGLRRSVIAYEPVWAIGTGKTATPDQAQAVHAFIRARVTRRSSEVAAGLRILYGGSVKASNSSGLFGMPDIDGGLIGGASLDAAEFTAICEAADRKLMERV